MNWEERFKDTTLEDFKKMRSEADIESEMQEVKEQTFNAVLEDYIAGCKSTTRVLYYEPLSRYLIKKFWMESVLKDEIEAIEFTENGIRHDYFVIVFKEAVS